LRPRAFEMAAAASSSGKSGSDKPPIQHDTKAMRFFRVYEQGECEITYTMPKPNVMSIDHTVVPKALEGKGIAAEMATFALDYAQSKSYKVVPVCSYIEAFINKKKSQYGDLVTGGSKQSS